MSVEAVAQNPWLEAIPLIILGLIALIFIFKALNKKEEEVKETFKPVIKESVGEVVKVKPNTNDCEHEWGLVGGLYCNKCNKRRSKKDEI